MEKEVVSRTESKNSQDRRTEFRSSGTKYKCYDLKDCDNPCKDSFEKLRNQVARGDSLDLAESLSHTKLPIDYQNETGMTLLHLACKGGQWDSIRVLLQAGADPNKTDELGRTPLHWVLDVGCHCEFCSNKAYRSMEMLLEYGADVNATDHNGENLLRYAAKSMLPKCALELVDHGAEVVFEPTENCIRYILNDRMPEVLVRFLDKAITFDEEDNSRLKLNFGWFYVKNCNGIGVKDTNTISQEQFLGDKKVKNIPQFGELSFLVKMAHGKFNLRGRKEILTHPWVEAFLHLKWTALRRVFWAIRFSYALFVFFYTFFTFEIYVVKCPYDKFYSRNQTNSDSASKNIRVLSDEVCEPSAIHYVCGWIGIFCAATIIKNELFEFKLEPKAYLRNWLNIFWWLLIASLIVTLMPAFGMTPRPWHYPTASFGLFYVWAMHLTQISRMPFYGEYVEMLGKVLLNFFTFLLTFSSIIIAFTLGMCIMFSKNEFFKSVPLGFVKILILMIGEDDYDGLFSENERLKDWEYAVPANLMYAGFIAVVTIVLTNLLLGLAVSDIQELRKKSSFKSVTRTIIQISFLESFIASSPLCGRIVNWVFPNNSVEKTIGRSCTFSPLNPDDKLFPEDLKKKFVPYLTSCPCLNKHKKLKMKSILAPIRWKNFVNHKNDSLPQTPTEEHFDLKLANANAHAHTQDEGMEQTRLMFRSLAENLMDLKEQLEKINFKIERKLK